jgi:hypothetical protein
MTVNKFNGITHFLKGKKGFCIVLLVMIFLLTTSIAAYAEQVTAPTADPPAGTYGGPQKVTLSTKTEGATIHFTINQAPRGAQYTSPIEISSNTTIAAYAVKDGLDKSPISTFEYVIIFAGGEGTLANPYQVATVEQLNNVRYYLDKHFIQTADIDLSSYNTGLGWEPIGSNSSPFTGTFDSNGKTISNLTINRSTANYVGLFGVTDTAEIQNIKLENTTVNGKDYTGALVGCNKGIITNSYATGAVTGQFYVGGLVGYNSSGTITKSYATSTVTGQYYVGGLAGSSYDSRITNSYATGDVKSEVNYVGGLVAYNGQYSYITNSYATGAVTGKTDIGGLVGINNQGTVSNSYWDTDTSGMNLSAGGEGVVGKTTAEMKQQGTYQGWDFDNIWSIQTNKNKGYPFLKDNPSNSDVDAVDADKDALTWDSIKGGNNAPDNVTTDLTNPLPTTGVNGTTISWSVDRVDWINTTTGEVTLPTSGQGHQIVTLTATISKGMFSGIKNFTLTIINPTMVVTPNASLASGTYGGTQNITLYTVTEGATIYYTNDNSEPTTASIQYATPIEAASNTTIKAIAVKEGLENSPVSTFEYVIFAGGDGSEANPYQVATAEQLNNVRYNLGTHFQQTADINLNSYNTDSGWEPIGSNSSSFNGTFDGNGSTISNLTINRSTTDYVGLFGATGATAKIQNVKLENTNVIGRGCTGALAGDNYGAITNSYVMGAVTGSTSVGGLVGRNASSISDSYTSGSVEGNWCSGGLVGYHSRGTITLSYSTSTVKGERDVGGLVGGTFDGGTITNSYARGAVTGTENCVGGLVGYNSTGSITNAYAAGAVTGKTNIGGLVGQNTNNGTVTKSYWDTTTSKIESSAGGEGVAGKTTAEMKQQGTYVDWDFTNTWSIETNKNKAYPFLKNNPPNPDVEAVDAAIDTLTWEIIKGENSTPDNITTDLKSPLPTTGANDTTISWSADPANWINTTTTTGAVTLPTSVQGHQTVVLTATISKGMFSGIKNFILTIIAPSIVATPSANLASGTYGGAQNITLSTVTEGATIFYTNDNSEPTTASTQYTTPIEVVSNTVIKAIAVKEGLENSSVSTFEYVIFAGGEGSAANPYQVATVEQLNNVRYHLYKDFQQTADINLSSYNTGSGWEPIGNNSSKFDGTFDGNGYTISNLTIERSTNNVGLFGATGVNAKIQNVKLENTNVTGNWYTGALAGINYGTITNSYVMGAVTGTGYYVGGLVGYNESPISGSYTSGSVEGNRYTGGLVGHHYNGTITHSYSTSTVKGEGDVGGLVGSTTYGTITNSYARGAVTGTQNRVGGLVGFNSHATITNAYATGVVKGIDDVGGLVGAKGSDSTVTKSYWDITTSGTESSAGGEGKTTADMKDKITFEDAGWNFTDTWAIDASINDGYPFLGNNLLVKKTLVSITAPSAIIDVANATAKTAAALGLPAKVTLITDQGNVQADVTWNVEACSYDPAVTTEQSFTVDGIVTLPTGVVNPNYVDLNTSVNVTVAVADECFIATAAFGSKFSWPVEILRHFRDQYLLSNAAGTAFVKFYYQNSPPIAAVISNNPTLKTMVRVLLAPLVASVFLLYHPAILLLMMILAIVLITLRIMRRRYLLR